MPGEFVWNGQRLDYFDHPYNHTALNMRRVEIPIARYFIAQSQRGARILEIGNVLSHYGPVKWPVVDLCEPGAIRADVMKWKPAKPVDLLISISTIEHIGFGKYAGTTTARPESIIRRLRSFLARGGLAILTAPTGYNHALDISLKAGKLHADRAWFMRAMPGREWAECTMAEALAMSPRACHGRWNGGLMILALEG